MAVTTQSTGASLLWEGLGGNFGGRRRHRHRRRRRGHRLGHRAAPGRGQSAPPWIDCRSRARATATATATARTSRASSRAAARAAGLRRQRLRRHGAGRGAHQSEGARRGRLGLRVGRHRAIEWAIENKDRFKHPRHQPVARRRRPALRDDPMAKAVERAVAAGIVVVARPAISASSDGTPIVGAHRLAGLHAGRADGWRAEHARHGRAVGRCGGDLQLAWAGRRSGRSGVVGNQAGSGGAGQRDCRGRRRARTSGRTTRAARVSARTAERI